MSSCPDRSQPTVIRKNYPKFAVPKMGNFTQKWYGKFWVKKGRLVMDEPALLAQLGGISDCLLDIAVQ
jgi:hypothetical protein